MLAHVRPFMRCDIRLKMTHLGSHGYSRFENHACYPSTPFRIVMEVVGACLSYKRGVFVMLWMDLDLNVEKIGGIGIELLAVP